MNTINNKEYNENEFFTTKDKILLGVDNRGGFFLNPKNNVVENIVYTGSGYSNCIYGNLKFMKRQIREFIAKGRPLDIEYTKEGKEFLELSDA